MQSLVHNFPASVGREAARGAFEVSNGHASHEELRRRVVVRAPTASAGDREEEQAAARGRAGKRTPERMFEPGDVELLGFAFRYRWTQSEQEDDVHPEGGASLIGRKELA